MDRQQICKELETILNVVDEKLLERVKITEATHIREGLGMDSLQLTEVLFEIEERLGAKISDEEARNLRTVGDLVGLIEVKTAKK
jgi:acyl carrier protein